MNLSYAIQNERAHGYRFVVFDALSKGFVNHDQSLSQTPQDRYDNLTEISLRLPVFSFMPGRYIILPIDSDGHINETGFGLFIGQIFVLRGAFDQKVMNPVVVVKNPATLVAETTDQSLIDYQAEQVFYHQLSVNLAFQKARQK